MFAEEKPHLLPLPLEPFRYYQYGERVVHLDGCVEVEAAYYSLPPGWIGRPVKVQWDELQDRKSTRLNSSHSQISYAVFCLKKKKTNIYRPYMRNKHSPALTV